MSHYPNIMIDIETTGTDPEHSAIIQISAVAFNLEAKTIDVENMFDRCLVMAPDRYWDEGTREWWSQFPDVYAEICLRSEQPNVVMDDFHAWVMERQLLEPAVMWAKPLSFEAPFLTSYFRQFGKTQPFKYWMARDLNSYIHGRGHKHKTFWDSMEFHGDKHNALHDVLHQIQGALTA